jgi:ribulose-phosphate 3-epimerase
MTSVETSKTSRPAPQIFVPFAAGNGARAPKLVIAPSVLSSDFAWEARELSKCRRARAPWVHIDIMDGHFVPNITFGPPILKKWTAAEPDLFYDTHLMIEKPMQYAEAFAQAGASLINIHIETTSRPRRDLRALRKLGVKTGLTIKPRTPVKEIAGVLDEVDLVLVMTVEPGFGGQAMIPKTLNKVRELDLIRRREGLPFRLQVDGGINVQTAPLAVAAGADVLVAGNAVFDGGRIAENLKALYDILTRASA